MKKKYNLKVRGSNLDISYILEEPLYDISRLFANSLLMIQKIVSVLLMSAMFSSVAMAHRGAKNEVDTCRFSVGSEVIHFSAYTPKESGGTSYCHFIPNIDETHLVFDYEGKKLRNTTVEFEITKEPDGTRIFYQKPEKIKKGSVDAIIDFKQFGAGDYLSHVTIMYKGEKLDSHLPFSIGIAEEKGGIPYKIVIPVLLMIVSFFVVPIVVKARQDKKNNV